MESKAAVTLILANEKELSHLDKGWNYRLARKDLILLSQVSRPGAEQMTSVGNSPS